MKIISLIIVKVADRNLIGRNRRVKKMSNTKRICCKDCIFFVVTRNGERGGIKGRCRIRRPNEIRAGSMTACKTFGRNEVEK